MNYLSKVLPKAAVSHFRNVAFLLLAAIICGSANAQQEMKARPAPTPKAIDKQNSIANDRFTVQFKSGVNPVFTKTNNNVTSNLAPLNLLLNRYGYIDAKRINAGSKNEIFLYSFVFSRSIDVNAVIKEFQTLGYFDYCEPDYKIGASIVTPNDPYFVYSWGLNNNGSFAYGSVSPTSGADIKMKQAWDITTGSSSVIVAVIDAGCRMGHPEFAGRIWNNSGEIAGNGIDDDGDGYVDDYQGWNYSYNNNNPTDDHSHGTNVAGIIGANGNNGIGYAGIDWNCKLMILKTLDSNGSGVMSTTASAIYYATDHGAKVINMSLGGYGYSSATQSAIDYAYAHGVTCIAAMGNDNSSTPFYPAAMNHVIAVGATRCNDSRATFSNFGSHISVVAPGEVIFGLSYLSNTDYTTGMSGTSQATPHVSGVAALLLAQDGTRNFDQIKNILESSADDRVGNLTEDAVGFDNYYGHGRINAFAALNYSCAPPAITGVRSVCSGATTTLANSTSGGTWSSGATGIATIGSTTGVVTGIAGGTASISYTIGTGCFATTVVTVTPSTAPITGLTSIYAGATTTMANAISGGRWTSSATAVATIGTTTGLLTGVAAGTTTISYTATNSCGTIAVSTTVAVLPAYAIPGYVPTGSMLVWLPFSGNANNAYGGRINGTVVGPTLTADRFGTANSAYQFSGNGTYIKLDTTFFNNGWSDYSIVCWVNSDTFYNPNAGSNNQTILNTIPHYSLELSFNWASNKKYDLFCNSNPGVTAWNILPPDSSASRGTIHTWSHIAFIKKNNTSYQFYINGVLDRSYTSANLAISSLSKIMIGRIDPSLPNEGFQGKIDDFGMWNRALDACEVARIARNSNLSYLVTSPTNVTATTSTNARFVTTATGTGLIYQWQVTSGTGYSNLTGTAPYSGVTTPTLTITSVSAPLSGNNYRCIISSVGSCVDTSNGATLTVTGISGPATLCPGQTATFASSVGGGTWSSSNTAVATIGIVTGLATGVASGTSIITYTPPLGLGSVDYLTLTVGPIAGISGPTAVCPAQTITLTHAVTGGLWTNSGSGVLSVGSASGIVTGIAAGTSEITYTLPTGCATVYTVSVYPTAPISGSNSVCAGQTINLTNGISGGAWSSSSVLLATVGSASGIVTGITGGVAYITYTFSTGCFVTYSVTVIGGGSSVQNIITIAGTGTGSSTGDGGPATAAALFKPNGLVASGSDIYIADYGNNRIRKINSSGVISRYAGSGVAGYSGDNGPATAANIKGPWDIAMDGAGNVYFSDAFNHRVRRITPSGIISTFAGTGVSGFSGDGGQATAAQFNTPTGLAFDAAGNLYVTELYNHRVRKITAAGIITTFAGTGVSGFSGDGAAATAAKFYQPAYVRADNSGNIYITDNGNHRIRKVSAAGIVTTIAGTGTAGNTGDNGPATAATLNLPAGLAFDASGNLFIADNSNSRIRMVNAAGIITGVAGTGVSGFSGDGGAATAAKLNLCSNLTFDAGGNLLVTDYINNRIRKLNPVTPSLGAITGTLTFCVGGTSTLANSLSGGTWSSSAGGIASIGSITGVVTGNAAGTATISYTTSAGCYATTTVTVVSSVPAISGASTVVTGSAISLTNSLSGGVWTTSNTGVATVNSTSGIVTGVSVGTSTITYSLSAGCFALKNISVNNLPPSPYYITTIAGTGVAGYSGDGGPATAAKLSGQWGVRHDQAGNVYILDYNNCKIRKISPDGTITSIAGTGAAGSTGDGGPATAARITTPVDMIFDNSGNIIFTDFGNHKIRKISTSGIITTIAGTGTAGLTGDGGAATSATFYYPAGLTMDATGNIYVVDEWNNRIRKISASGIVSTIAGTGSTGFMNGGYSGDGGAATAAQINFPTDIKIDASGNLIFCDNGNKRIRKITPAGIINTIAGTGTAGFSGDGGAATAARVNTPEGLYIDAGSNIYFSDINNFRIRKVNAAGIITTIAGSSTSVHSDDYCSLAAAGIVSPTGVSVDNRGNIYFSDRGGNRIRKIAVNLAPFFNNGDTQNFTYCSNPGTIAIDSALAVTDTDKNQLLIWSAVYAPAHGTLAAAYSDTSNGFTKIPTGLNYTPTTGFTGVDSFGVAVSDCMGKTDTTYIRITIGGGGTPITGATTVCTAATTTLANATTGGTWSSSNTAIATIGSVSGIVAGVTPGTTTISYLIAGGCTSTAVVTVAATPAIITGAGTVNVGSSVTLANTTSGGIWASSNTGIATIGSTTGIVTGISAGVTTITYALSSGCYVTKVATVTAVSLSISGPTSICPSATITLGGSPSGGVWTSGSTGIAAVGSSSGIVTGVAAGTALISYTLSGSTATYSITVTTLPNAGAITGVSAVCVGATTTLSNAATGGAWSSSSANATVTGGVVTGVTAGATVISYTVTNSCGTAIATKAMTVDPLPSAGTISGSSNVCVGTTTTLSNAATGGAWNSSSANATVTGGVVTGVTAGTTVISYSVTNGCGTAVAIKTITVDPLPVAGTITGATSVCVGATTTLSNALSGGVWSSSSTNAAVTGGVVTGVTAGATVISYTVTNSCGTAIATKAMTVDPLPVAGTITGATSVCVGATTTLSNAITGGVWSSSSANATVTGGVVTGVTAGTTIISYTVTNGCGIAAAIKSLSVNAAPSAGSISGASSVAVSSTTTLTSSVTGGLWSSSTPGVATIGSLTGIATGVSAGTALISYTVVNGCGSAVATKSITVTGISLSAITGATALCTGATTTLANTTSGGTWRSSAPAIASIGSLTGVVTGIASGSAVITYTVATSFVTTTITVGPLSTPVAGATAVCVGATTTLTNATTGGLWSSGAIAKATVGSLTGVVTGVVAGTATITYSLGAGCIATRALTVATMPVAITGSTSVCMGATSTLTNTSGGGYWSSSLPAVASIGSVTGELTGISAGTSIISYATLAGCVRTTTVGVINVTPIIGANQVCVGQSIMLSNSTPGGTWASSRPTSATIGSGTGLVSGIAAGATLVSYNIGSCRATQSVTVNPLAAITGASSVCQSQPLALSNAIAGGVWSSGNNAVAIIGSASGSAMGVSGGTTIITYALNTGCMAFKSLTVIAIGANAGPGSVCTGQTITLSNSVPGGVWSSTSSIIAQVGSATGVVSGIAPGATNISYTLNGCRTVSPLVVNTLSAITGTTSILVGQVVTLISATGGLWSSGTPGVATIGSASGLLTGISSGTSVISYVLPTGCSASVTVSVSQLPAITGDTGGCVGQYKTLRNVITGGRWTSGNTTIATIGATTGILYGVSGGSVNITYAFPTGGQVVFPYIVNRLSPISGPTSVCSGQMITLTNVDCCGSYLYAGSPGVASVGFSSGVVTGVSAGTAVISYVLPTGCTATTTITVKPFSPITGSGSVCVGATTTLANATSGGTWTSSNAIMARVNATTGIVTGVAMGSLYISYTIAATGCIATAPMMVNSCRIANDNSAGTLQSQLTLMPNPNNGSFTLSGVLKTTNDQEATIRIANMLGQVVLNNAVSVKNGLINEQINLNSAIAAGNYILYFTTENEIAVMHLVVTR